MSKPRMRLQLRQRQTIRQKLKLKHVVITTVSLAALTFIGFVAFFSVGPVPQAKAASTATPIDSGSYIVDMGIVPQTVKNGLVPYGMIYELVHDYLTPVYWVISDLKAKDGKDFTYNGVDYKGGPFIIPAKYISSTIKQRITWWGAKGVQGVYTTSTVDVPVYSTLSVMPTMTIDNSSGKQSIITGYFDNALIPSTAYALGLPSSLTNCYDLWINPHGDPTWATHNSLYNFAAANGSFIFSQCHATSMMEGCKNTVAPFQQLNFLTTNGLKCYSSNKCGAAITETHGGNPTGPFTYNFPNDPMMQFMGTADAALSGGSEDWYIPQSTGGWRPTTRRVIATSDGVSPNEGVLAAYGPAYGLANAGWVMYEASHDFGGTTAAAVSAQRLFFNFMIFAAAQRSVSFSSDNIPTDFVDNSSTVVTLSVNVGHGTPPYNYNWSTTISGATFGSPTLNTTTFVLPKNLGRRNGTVSVKVVDACAKQNFLTRPINIAPNPLPVTLASFNAMVNKNNTVQLNWTTASEKDNDYFTLERSEDGDQFKEVANVKGAGNSNKILQYSYLDEHPFNGTSYYRLKQTDYNGRSETFKTVSVKVKQSPLSNIKLYPNPISRSFTADFESTTDGMLRVQLINMNGALVHTENIMVVKGRNSCHFEVRSALSKGAYLLRIASDQEVYASERVTLDE